MRTIRMFTAAALSALTASSATSQTAPSELSSPPEEVVVIAQRSGIPVWQVSGPVTTIALVGAIDGIAKDTKWDAGSLDAAIVRADRVMFPDAVAVTGSKFSMLGHLLKWRRQAILPTGQGLSTLLTPAQYARIAALQARGVLKQGWERSHPLHLAFALRAVAKGGTDYGPTVGQHVARTVKQHGVVLVPVAESKAKRVAGDLFGSSPSAHVSCLMDAVALIEAGSGAVKARSDAWAQRRVVQVRGSPAERVYRSCWPSGGVFEKTPDIQLGAAVQRLMVEPKSTVAILSLDSLARPGGVLDDLRAAGFSVRGPSWRD